MLAFLLSLGRRWVRAATSRKPTPIRRLRPCLELLEDRCVPSASIAEFPVLTASSSPYGIAAGPDGNLWFTESQANQIGMINPTTHAVSEFSIPSANSGPLGIAAGPDGNLWFTENQANQIGMINPTTHAISAFSIPTANSGPAEIAAGPDGNLWFTENQANQIGMINPTTHAITEFAIPTASSEPLGIAAGPDGNIWFTESNGNKIGTINPTLHTITEYAIPQGSSEPTEITAGPNGNMWFVESGSNAIGQMNTSSHAVSVVSIPTGTSASYGITAGPDGNIWFTEGSANQIGEVNLATRVVSQTALPTASADPTEIVAGPGGTLWFTEASGNQIGEVVASPTITTAPVDQAIVAGQSATFTAAAVGFPTPTVLWQVSTNAGASFTPLTNAGVYSGVTTDTLTITAPTTAMTDYEYEAVFSNGVPPSPATASPPAALIVKSPLSIIPALPPEGVAGASYNQTLTVAGSTTPFDVFAVTSFNAGTTGLTPSNITTNPISGTITISGTPSAGTATFTVTVANTAGYSLTQNLVLTIVAPLSIATASLPTATAAMSYNQAITVAGGVLPYTTFTVTNWSAGTTGLKAGDVTAHPTTGVFQVSGTPSAAGTATFTVDVTSSDGSMVTKNFTLNVDPPLVITPSLPAGTAGTNYNQALTVSGGGVPYTTIAVSGFSGGATGLTTGNVSTSTAAATVTLAGTPTAAGTVTFTVNVVDAVGAVLNKTYTVTINPTLALTGALPPGTAGASYHQTLTVSRRHQAVHDCHDHGLQRRDHRFERGRAHQQRHGRHDCPGRHTKRGGDRGLHRECHRHCRQPADPGGQRHDQRGPQRRHPLGDAVDHGRVRLHGRADHQWRHRTLQPRQLQPPADRFDGRADRHQHPFHRHADRSGNLRRQCHRSRCRRRQPRHPFDHCHQPRAGGRQPDGDTVDRGQLRLRQHHERQRRH